jgi:hypothetical protein
MERARRRKYASGEMELTENIKVYRQMNMDEVQSKRKKSRRGSIKRGSSQGSINSTGTQKKLRRR